MIQIDRLDHLVLTVADIEKTCAFYRDVLGFEIVTFGTGRKALKFGLQKFNLHQVGHEFEPNAHKPTSGSADLCIIATTPVEDVIVELIRLKIVIEEGPVERTGANGPIRSVYIRDPDLNLIEISNYRLAT
ncbi:VOC family protein [Acetobacter sp. DsW_063]|uniref:VOC family protein n=1 Tax=Acetobacter sp. DsW_063 TaxID=1514894 RepID=UPI0018E9110A|nr:VOC family protein [Acetobacter sp. DsW_063]